MARLLSWPDGLSIADFTKISGPISSGASEDLTISGQTQHVTAVKSPFVFSVVIPPQQKSPSRRVNGFLTGLSRGVNALRFPFRLTKEMPSFAELGLSESPVQNWSNGQPWSNGKGWRVRYPTETVAASSNVDTGSIQLGSSSWGEKLGIGDYVGFRSHFGVYEITQTYLLEPGKYRVWPPLRKAITTSDVATLEPVIVVKSVGDDKRTKTPAKWEPFTFTFAEINDPDVRTHYTEN